MTLVLYHYKNHQSFSAARLRAEAAGVEHGAEQSTQQMVRFSFHYSYPLVLIPFSTH